MQCTINTAPDFPKGTPLKIAGTAMIATIDRAKRKYNRRLSDEERREINRANGKKGGAPKGNQNARKKTATDQKADKEPEKPAQYMIDLIEQMDEDLQKIGSGLWNILSSKEIVELVTVFFMYYDDKEDHRAPFDTLFQKKNNIGAYDFRDEVKKGHFSAFMREFKETCKEYWTEDLCTSVDEYQDSYSNTKSKVKTALEYMNKTLTDITEI